MEPKKHLIQTNLPVVHVNLKSVRNGKLNGPLTPKMRSYNNYNPALKGNISKIIGRTNKSIHNGVITHINGDHTKCTHAPEEVTSPKADVSFGVKTPNVGG
jgi:hypothetical protein